MSNQPVINLAIGAIAGCVANAIVFPIDTAKTKMQSGAKCSDSHEKCGVLCQIQRVVKDEGIGGLYKGVVPVLIGSAPETAIQLTVYDIASTTIRNIENIQQSVSTMPMHLQALAGGLAGMSTVIATNPLEVLKIRAQTSTEKKTMMEEIKELGFGGLFHGYQATWFRDVPFAAIYFPVYTSLKVCVGPLCLGSLGSAMIAGMMSGFMASLVTTPADVIMTTFHTGGSKTTVKKLPLDPELVATEPADIGEILPAERLLALRAAQAAKAAQVEVAKAKAKTPICIGKDLVQEQGWGGLFNGVQGRLGRMAPAMAISLTVYETLQNLVGSPAPLQTGPVVLAKVEDFTASPASDGLSKVMAMASESSGSAEIPSEVANTLSKVDLQMLQEVRFLFSKALVSRLPNNPTRGCVTWMCRFDFC